MVQQIPKKTQVCEFCEEKSATMDLGENFEHMPVCRDCYFLVHGELTAKAQAIAAKTPECMGHYRDLSDKCQVCHEVKICVQMWANSLVDKGRMTDLNTFIKQNERRGL